MRCSICHKNMFLELRFKDLLYFDFTCSSCSKLLKMKSCVFPLDGGGVCEYLYFLEKEEFVSEIEYRGFIKLIEYFNKNRSSFIIFFDEETTDELWILKYIGTCQKTIIYSTIYIPPEDLFDEDF